MISWIKSSQFSPTADTSVCNCLGILWDINDLNDDFRKSGGGETVTTIE